MRYVDPDGRDVEDDIGFSQLVVTLLDVNAGMNAGKAKYLALKTYGPRFTQPFNELGMPSGTIYSILKPNVSTFEYLKQADHFENLGKTFLFLALGLDLLDGINAGIKTNSIYEGVKTTGINMGVTVLSYEVTKWATVIGIGLTGNPLTGALIGIGAGIVVNWALNKWGKKAANNGIDYIVNCVGNVK